MSLLKDDSTAQAFATDRARRRLQTKLMWATQIGEGLDGYILGGIAMAITALSTDLHLDSFMQGLVGASPLIGIFVGAPIFGWVADRIGRRPVFMVDMAIFLLFSLLQLFVGNGTELFTVRLIMGIAIGGEYAIGSPILSEYSNAKNRGRRLATLEVSWYVGYLAAILVGAIFLHVHDGWRWTLSSSAVVAVVCVALRSGVPESARWLLSKGRTDEATALIAKYGLDVDVEAEIADAGDHTDSFKALFSKKNLRSTVFAGGFWACLVLPYFSISTFWTQVFDALGLGDDATAALIIYSITAVLGVTAGCLVVDRIGRRKLLIPPFWVTAASLGVVAIWPGSTAVIVGGFLFFIFLNAASSALCAVYPGEVFPTSVRTTGVGFASAMSRVGAAIGTWLLPMGLHHYGVRFVLVIGAAVLALGAILSQFLAPETTDLDLAQAARLANTQGGSKA
jgi:putative MFS transporter